MYFLYCITVMLIMILLLIKYAEMQGSCNCSGSCNCRKRSGNGCSSGNSSHEGFTNRTYNGLTNNSNAPWTIEKNTKIVITDILKKILNIINKQTGMSYYFNGYDQLSQEELCPMRTRYTADFFVHELRNLHTRRLIVIFVVNFGTKQVDVEYTNLSNAFKSPTKDFMGVPMGEPSLILTDDNLLKNANSQYNIYGLNSSKIDFSILKDDEGKIQTINIPDGEFQRWILPLGIHSAGQNPQALFPSRRQSKYWDTNGANYIEAQTNLKQGVNNTSMIRFPQIYDNPTVNRQKDWNSDYKWLNDLVDNTSGIGRSVARSP
jgi:hypothetical protein